MGVGQKYMITLGDWSDDGHGKIETFAFKTNKDADSIRKAYRASEKLTGISFGNKSKEHIMYKICTQYEESVISFNALEVLEFHGLSVCHYVDGKAFDDLDFPEDCFFENAADKSGLCVTNKDLFYLIMWFIGLSLDDFIWEASKMPESINGYWNEDLNEQWGYGMFQ